MPRAAASKHTCKTEYVSFSFNPVIDGKVTDRRAQFTEVQELLDKLEIDYDFDKNKRLQIILLQIKP